MSYNLENARQSPSGNLVLKVMQSYVTNDPLGFLMNSLYGCLIVLQYTTP